MEYTKVIRIKLGENFVWINFDKITLEKNAIELYLKNIFISRIYFRNVFTFTYSHTSVICSDNKMVTFNLDIDDSIFI